MPEVTRRRTGELLRALFEILIGHPDGMQARDALAALRSQATLTPYEAGFYESGGTRFEKIVRFSTVDAVKAGWLIKQRGRWLVTEEGKVAMGAFPDPEAFYRRAVKLYMEWRNATPQEPVVTEAVVESEESNARITFEQAEEQAWSEIENHLRAMPPYEFQNMVAALLRGMGYHVSWIAPPGRDGGIDIIAWSDPLGTRPPRIKVQVKRQQQAVAVDGLRSFMAVLGDDDVGLFVSIGGFTKDAADEARTHQSRKVTLVDLERLFDLWVEHYGKLDETARRRMPLQPIYFLAPAT